MASVAIAAASQIAADSGVAVAELGGNAVDAAVAATVTGMCTDPGVIAPGGGVFITVWPAGADPAVIDGYVAVPGLGRGRARKGSGLRVSMEYGGGMETVVGHASVATPGAFAGLEMAATDYGVVPWAELMAPAVEWASGGFPLSATAASYLEHSLEPIFDLDPGGRSALRDGAGVPLRPGGTVQIAGLADALRAIASGGAAVFYTGDIGRLLTGEMERGGGIVTAADLASYRPVRRRPIIVERLGWSVATNPAPAVGGVGVAALLLLTRRLGFRAWDETGVLAMSAAQRALLGLRERHLHRGEIADTDLDRLLREAGSGDDWLGAGSPSTIHTSAVDAGGMACSITASAGYGSGLMIPGTGIWLNNSLGELELEPPGSGWPPPGRRLPSNMAPTVARHRTGPVLAIGSPGASRITTAVGLTLINLIELGMAPGEAVEHPRFHLEVFDGVTTAACEPGLPVPDSLGLPIRRFPERSMYFGGVGLALGDAAGRLDSFADGRRTLGVASGGAQ